MRELIPSAWAGSAAALILKYALGVPVDRFAETLFLSLSVALVWSIAQREQRQ